MSTQSKSDSNRYQTVVVENVILLRSTENAGLYRDALGDEFWIPWSQLKDDSVDKDGDEGDIRIPLWLAREKGLEYFVED
jgi:hypothetical protein